MDHQPEHLAPVCPLCGRQDCRKVGCVLRFHARDREDYLTEEIAEMEEEIERHRDLLITYMRYAKELERENAELKQQLVDLQIAKGIVP